MNNGYIQKNIGGQSMGLKFNQMALVMFMQLVDFDNYDATANYAMVFAGLSANAYAKTRETAIHYGVPDPGQPQKVADFEMVSDWVEEIPVEDMNEIAAVFKDTKSFRQAMEKAEEITKKKLMNTKESV